MWSKGGVVWGKEYVWKVLFGHKFNPVRELHTPTTALAENAILMGSAKYHRMKDFSSGCIKDFDHHLELDVVQGLGWQFGAIGAIVDISVRNPGVKRGLNTYHSPEEPNVIGIYLFNVRCGQGKRI